MRKTLQVCIASQQLQPNVIPLMELVPDELLVVASDKTQGQASKICQIAQEMQIRASVFPLPVPSSGYEKLLDFFKDLSPAMDNASNVQINLTGGNKLMTLALTEVFSGVENNLFFYTDTDSSQIAFLKLSGSNNKIPAKDFSKPLSLKQVLSCAMADIESSASASKDLRKGILARETFTDAFCREAIKNRVAIASLNRQLDRSVLSADGSRLKSKHLRLETAVERALGKALELADADGLLSYDRHHAEITFESIEQARWLHGIWLEEFVWLKMRSAALSQSATSLKLKWQLEKSQTNKWPANELDAVCTHNNRVCIVECKTGKLDEGKGQNIIHKISRLKDQLAGPFGSALLITLNPPDNALINRAKHNNVEVISGHTIAGLKGRFEQWRNNGHF